MKRSTSSIILFILSLIFSALIATNISKSVVRQERADIVNKAMSSFGDLSGFFILTGKYSKIGTVRVLNHSNSGKIYIENINGRSFLSEDEKSSYESQKGFEFSLSNILGISFSNAKTELVSNSPDYSIQVKLKALNSSWEEELICFPGDDIHFDNEHVMEYDIYARLPSNTYPHLGYLVLGELNNVEFSSVEDWHLSVWAQVNGYSPTDID